MKNSLLHFITVICINTVTAGPLISSQTTPYITFENNDGETFTFTQDEPKLFLTGLMEMCNAGVWVAFTDENYRGSMHLLNIGPQCRPAVLGTIRSARFAGDPLNYTLPSVTLFSKYTLAGNSTYYTDGIAEMPFKPYSFITIATNAVEFFRDYNYEGESFCFEPYYCYQEVCWQFGAEEYEWELNLAKSVRSGCTVSTKVPKPNIGGHTLKNELVISV